MEIVGLQNLNKSSSDILKYFERLKVDSNEYLIDFQTPEPIGLHEAVVGKWIFGWGELSTFILKIVLPAIVGPKKAKF